MHKLMIVTALAATVPSAALAQTASRPGTTGAATAPARPGMALQAFEARRERKMMASDTDGDGRINRSEYLAAAKAGRADPAKRFAKLDRNDDGYLDKMEIKVMLARRFKRLDTNGDGVVTTQERTAATAARQGMGQGSGKASDVS